MPLDRHGVCLWPKSGDNVPVNGPASRSGIGTPKGSGCSAHKVCAIEGSDRQSASAMIQLAGAVAPHLNT
jgi:hypothetical protein